MYVIDTSDDVSAKTLDQYKRLLANDLKTKDIGEGKVTAGILVYGSDAVLLLTPKSGNSESILTLVLSELQRVNGPRNYKAAFDYILNNVFNNPRFVDPSAKKMVVVLTDGKSKDWSKNDELYYKNELDKVNAEVVVISSDPDAVDSIKNLATRPGNVVTINPGSNSNATSIINKALAKSKG